MKRVQSFDFGKPATLGELRAFLVLSNDLPDSARVYIRTGFGGGSRHGSRPTSLTVEYDSDRDQPDPVARAQAFPADVFPPPRPIPHDPTT